MKNISSFARFVSVILMLALICSFAASCAEVTEDPKATNQSTESTEAIAATDGSTATGDQIEETEPVTPTADFNQETITILYWSDCENPEFLSTGDSGETVNQAINRKNVNTEAALNIKLEFIGQDGDNGNVDTYTKRVQSLVDTGDKQIDILATYSQTMPNVALAGYCLNLKTANGLDLDKPWWPNELTKEVAIGNNIYFISGDISTNLLYMMYVVFFNKDMIEDNNLESPYTLVENKQWTVDKILEMSESVYRDSGDGLKDETDTFGFVLPKLAIDAFFYGSGLRTTDKDARGNLIVSSTYFSEKAQDLLDKLNTACTSQNSAIFASKRAMFTEGRAMFYTDRAVAAINDFSQSEDLLYGVVPAPLWDESQTSYITCAGNPFTLYAIISNCDNVDQAATTLEALAVEAYKTTTPAIFEVSMKLKYSKDEQSSQMYDIIRDTVCFDLGRMYGIAMENYTQTLYREAVMNKSRTWVSTGERVAPKIVKFFEKVNEKLGSSTGG